MAKVKKVSNTDEVQATIKQLVKQTLREALEAELEEFLGYKNMNEQILRTTETNIVLKLLKHLLDLQK